MTAKEIADLFAELELHLIASLKRNLMRHRKQELDEGGTGSVPKKWEAWQSAKLRDIQRFRRENTAILGEYQSVIHTETEKLLREQYAEGGADGFFHTSDDKLKALIDEMQNNEANVERAALRYMNDVYRKTVLRTATAMTSGGMTLQQATDEATRDFLAQGINCVQYSNGRCVNIASYAEMALRTCSTRAMLMGEAKQRERLGIDTVLVSQYGACSDTCLPWQGKVYIDDVFQDYHGPRGGSFGISRNGRSYMFLSVAIKGGLFHPNCRHTISTWIEGVSTRPRPMPIREIERVNKLEARQRRLERAVRQAKREEAGLSDPEAIKAAKTRRREAQAKLREFVRENSDVLRRDYWRERDNGVPKDWGTAENSVANSESRGIINTRGLAMSLRMPKSHILTEEEIQSVLADAHELGIDEKLLRFNKGFQTGFSDERGCINIRGDILPDINGITARDRMSQRAVLAHEYYGHYRNHPSEYPIGDWRDEFRASYDAAVNAPNLSPEERRDLMIDAYDRAKEAGAFQGYDETARRIVYGF